MHCILCIGKNPITDHNPLTDEHIFPEAIGGDMIFEKSLCKHCNSSLGSNIDIHLTEHLSILYQRKMFGLTGKKGGISNPLPEFIDSYGRRGNLTTDSFNFRSTKINCSDTAVAYIPSNNETWDESIEALNKILTRSNHPPLSKEKIDELKLMASQQTETLISASTKIFIDLIEYRRSFFKIAYELTIYWLGNKYINDPMAIKLRECLNCIFVSDLSSPKHWSKNFSVNYNIEIYNESTLKNIFKNTHINSHSALLRKTGNYLICFIKIFQVFIGYVCVSKNSEQYPNFRSEYVEIKIPN